MPPKPEQITEALQQSESIIKNRHGRQLGAIARRFDADDLYQTTCLKAHQGSQLCQAESIEQLRHWVLTIAKNALSTAVTTHTCGKRSIRRECSEPFDVAAAGSTANDLSDELAIVHRQIDDLPPRQATAIRMRYLDQSTYSEIAAELNVTIMAARTLVSRGIATIRKSV